MELAKAYVQIVPTAKGIKGSITKELGGEADSAGKSAGASLGSGLVGALKGVIAAAGIGAIVKSALDAGGDLQQSFGGLETIYGDAADAAKEYAKEAASAGISMNDYAEQAVSFGASLKQAFEGDTARAVEAANTAILDMADNAAKMGTPLENIQSAYQGFAKQNYTMLDNLKLGYGGTKSEMERLLKDAQKLSGVEYNIENLGDVYDAIHVIQEDLGLTGVAAAEASETFTGSLGAVKASFTNLLGTLATGGDIYTPLMTLLDNVKNFLFNNLLPMLADIVGKVPQILGNLLYEFGHIFEDIDTDGIVSFGANLIADLIAVIGENAPYMIAGVLNLIKSLANSIIKFDWMGLAKDTMHYLYISFIEIADDLFGGSDFVITDLIKGIMSKISEWANVGIDLISKLAQSIVSNLPTIMEKGKELLRKFIDGILAVLPDIYKTVFTIIAKFIATVGQNLPMILESGIKLLGEFIAGILKTIPKVVEAIPKVITAIKEAFENFDWKEIGKNILEGIANGVKEAVTHVADAAKDAAKATIKAAKDALDIHSPSRVARDQIGAQFARGMALGIEENAKTVTNAIKGVADGAVLNGAGIMGTASYNRYSNASGDYSALVNALNNNTNVVVTLEGDAARLFNVVQSKARQYNMQTGRNAFA